jgi:hypothetical protein
MKTLTNYANFHVGHWCSQLNLCIKDFEAAGAVIKEIPKAASDHIKGFPKATGVDNISQISSKAYCDFRNPVNMGTSVFWKLFYDRNTGILGYLIVFSFETAFMKTLINYANFLVGHWSSQLNLVKDFEAGGAVIKEIPKAASDHITGFPKAAGVDNISQISSKFYCDFRNPVNMGTSVFWKLFYTGYQEQHPDICQFFHRSS